MKLFRRNSPAAIPPPHALSEAQLELELLIKRRSNLPPYALSTPQAKQPKTGSRLKMRRTKFRDLSIGRIFRGGRIDDLGRTSRYALIVASGLGLCWLPAIAYVKLAKPSYSSHFGLILPGAGSSSSINVSDIGQATSAAASAYSSPSLSPTITYKNLIMSANVVNAAGAALNVDPDSLPMPVIKLVDETSFITVEMSGSNAKQARDRADAIQTAFLLELNKLRDDELERRESSTIKTVQQYEVSVNDIRKKISELQIESGLNSTEQFSARVGTAENLKSKIAETEAAISKVKQSAASLAKNLRTTPEVAAMSMKLHADPEFVALADATSKAESDFAETSRQFGPNHPKVVESRAKFEGAHQKMLAHARSLTGIKINVLAKQLDLASTGQRPALMSQLVTLQTEQDGLESELDTMKTELSDQRQSLAALTGTAARLDSLNRDYKVAEAVFASALARISTSKTDIFASYPMVQVIEPAIMPLLPSSPNKKVAMGSAGAATGLLFIALLLGWIRRPIIDKLIAKAKPKHA